GGKARLDEMARHQRAGAPDAGTAVDIQASAAFEQRVDLRQDLGHVRRIGRYAVILDRLAKVDGVFRQVAVIGRQFTGLGQIDEGIESGVEQRTQPPLQLLQVFSARIFAGQQSSRNDPVRLSYRLWKACHPY